VTLLIAEALTGMWRYGATICNVRCVCHLWNRDSVLYEDLR
jgi:hypothetical protein